MEVDWPQEQRGRRSTASAFTRIWCLKPTQRIMQNLMFSTKAWCHLFHPMLESPNSLNSTTPILIPTLKKAFIGAFREIRETKTKLVSWTLEETWVIKANQQPAGLQARQFLDLVELQGYLTDCSTLASAWPTKMLYPKVTEFIMGSIALIKETCHLITRWK